MKKKIPIFILLRSLGLSTKKITYSLKNIDYIKKSGQIQNSQINTARYLTKLNEIMVDKESNIVWYEILQH